MLRHLALLALVTVQSVFAQPAKFNLNGKTYMVYPLRSNEEGIPPYFTQLPDGDYVMFREYDFTKKFMKKEMRLTDTTLVRAAFSFKNNMPEGKAVFYYLDKNIEEFGNYSAGLRDGVWEARKYYSYSKKRQNITHKRTAYKAGIKEGPYKEYNYYGKKMKSSQRAKFVMNDSTNLSQTGQYKNGERMGTWRYYYGKMNLSREYTITDSLSPVITVYDYMFPNDYDYDGDRGDYYHGLSLDYVGYGKNEKIEKVMYNYGRVIHFDTLYRYNHIPEYILTKVEKDKPDSVALFTLTHFYYDPNYTKPEFKPRVIEVIEFRSGKRIRSTGFDDKGFKDEETYYSGYYPTYKKGQLYLSNINYFLKSTTYTYSLKEFGQTFICRVSKTGDTTDKFKVWNVDTSAMTYSAWRYDKNDVTGIAWLFHKSGYPSESNSLYSTARTYERLDSSVMFHKNGSRFTGVSISSYKNRNKTSRLAFEKGKWVLYDNYKYRSRNDAGGNYSYTEYKNGVEHGKTIKHRKYRGFLETTEGYMKNGQRHGITSTRVHKYKLAKYERKRALENGIKKKKVTYISTQTEYVEGKINGRSFTADPTGVVRTETNYKEGIEEGTYISRHANGKIQTKAMYSNGKYTGKFERWNDEGILMEEAEYIDGNLNGYLKKFKSTGEPSFSIYAKNNILDGSAILYNMIGLMEWKIDFDVRDSVPYEYKDLKTTGTSYNDRYFYWNNDNLVKNLQVRLKPYPANFTYTEYFYTGKIAAEGKFVKGRMSGLWKFYDLDGNLIHEVDFKPEEIELPHESLPVMGRIKSYYSNGKLKSTGYLESFERNYDCKSRKNVYHFEIHFDNYWNPEGSQTLISGNGAFVHFDEHGQKISSGEYFEHMKNGFWKSWDKDGKLTQAGHYQDNHEEGSWWFGDLEGLSFVDNACFDMDSEDVQKEVNRLKKNLDIKHTIYREGRVIESRTYRMDMNKERDYRRRYSGRHIVDF